MVEVTCTAVTSVKAVFIKRSACDLRCRHHRRRDHLFNVLTVRITAGEPTDITTSTLLIFHYEINSGNDEKPLFPLLLLRSLMLTL